MSRASLLTAVSVLTVGVLCACTSFRPRVSTTNGGRGGPRLGPSAGEASTRGGIGTRGDPVGAPAATAGRAGVDSRRVCRSGARPSGWIAVAYVSAVEGECRVRATSDSNSTAAILTYYADRPVAALLDVCADEPVPRGWVIDEAAADASDACPGVDRNGSSTHRIRRVR